MANKPLNPEIVHQLLNTKRGMPKSPTKPIRIQTSFPRPDPTKFVQTGYPHPDDKGDIWAQWVKQGREGAKELIERWS